jgi:hypothetical protein
VTPARALLLCALAGMTALSTLLPAARGQAPSPSLYVYLPVEVKSSALEKPLRQQLPGLAVTVFGRFRDFEEAIARQRPDAILGLQPLLSSLAIPPALQGLRGDRDWEPYVLMSEVGVDGGGPAAARVGVVDLLGRTGTQELVSSLLSNPEVELRRVTKLEDLLPLLQFSAVGAVLVPISAAGIFSERSRMRLRVHPLTNGRVGLPALGVLQPELRARIVAQVQALDGTTLRMLGIERWRGL